jgi:hypothetical protein
MEHEQIEVAIETAARDLHGRVRAVGDEFLATDSQAREREAVLGERRAKLTAAAAEATAARMEWEASHSQGGVAWWHRPLPVWARWMAIPAVTIAEGAATFLLLAGFTSSVVTRALIAIIVGAVLALTGDHLGGEAAEWWRAFRQWKDGHRNHRRPIRMVIWLLVLVLAVGIGAGALRASGALGSSANDVLANAGLDSGDSRVTLRRRLEQASWSPWGSGACSCSWVWSPPSPVWLSPSPR